MNAIPADVLTKLQHVAYVRGSAFVAANAHVSKADVEAVCSGQPCTAADSTPKLIAWVKEFVS